MPVSWVPSAPPVQSVRLEAVVLVVLVAAVLTTVEPEWWCSGVVLVITAPWLTADVQSFRMPLLRSVGGADATAASALQGAGAVASEFCCDLVALPWVPW